MDKLLINFGELADKVSSSIYFLIVFNTVLVSVWLLFGVDQANIFISIITAEIVLVGAGAARRGNKALHAKLDEIIHALKDARDDLMGIESASESDIEKLKT